MQRERIVEVNPSYDLQQCGGPQAYEIVSGIRSLAPARQSWIGQSAFFRKKSEAEIYFQPQGQKTYFSLLACNQTS